MTLTVLLLTPPLLWATSAQPPSETSMGSRRFTTPSYSQVCKDFMHMPLQVSQIISCLTFLFIPLTDVKLTFTADQEEGMVRVQVVYSHPTQLSMLPCKFYMDGSCKFSSEKCKYSHGQDHNFLDLGEFREPDYSQIKSNREGTQLLALDTSCGLWKHATLVQYEDDQKVSAIQYNISCCCSAYVMVLCISMGAI